MSCLHISKKRKEGYNDEICHLEELFSITDFFHAEEHKSKKKLVHPP